MEGGAAEREEILRRQVAVMPPDRFEQLVFELAHREFPDVRRVQHPDGGADVQRPETHERRAEVWQAKRYPDSVNWKECEDSLKTAIKRWTPSKVTFVFARDLSQQYEASFQSRLVEHEAAVAANVGVELWNLSELVRRLSEHEDLKARFFGHEQRPLMAEIERMMRAGGQLQTGSDLVQRAQTLSGFAEEADRDFTYSVASSSHEAPAPQWPDLPYLQMQVFGPRARVDVTAWPRESAEVAAPTFGFTDDAAGREARDAALRRWAQGAEAVITSGGLVRFHAPELIRQLLRAGETLRGGTVRISPAPAFEAVLEVETSEETLGYRFEARTVPPHPPAFGALVGYIGDTFLEVTFERLDEDHARATFNLSAKFGSSARDALEAAKLISGWCHHKRVSLRTAQVYSEGIGGKIEEPLPEEVCEEMEWRAEFYADVVFLEDRLGIELPLPDQMTGEDLAVVATAAKILRTGEGTATFNNVSGIVDDPMRIPRLPDEFRQLGAMRRPVIYSVFGHDLELGVGEYELPPLKVVEIVPHGTTPTSPARVVLGAEGDDQMRFRLVGWTPPDESSGEYDGTSQSAGAPPE